MYLQQKSGIIYNGIELMIMESREGGEKYVVIFEEGDNSHFIIEKQEDIIHELPKTDQSES